jgi:hypothetical protein
MAILCILDGQEMAPLAVHWNLIKCPMIVDKDKRRRLAPSTGRELASSKTKKDPRAHGSGDNDFGSVKFSIKLEGIR